MSLELTQAEIETLDQALETWERETHSGVMVAAMLTAAIAGEKGRQKAEDEINKKIAAADEERKRRKIKSVMLRAKLMQELTKILVGQGSSV